MGVKRGHLENISHRQSHFLCQSLQHPDRQAMFLILNKVQIFDQQVTTARTISQKGTHSLTLLRLQQPPFGKKRPLATPGPRMDPAFAG